MAKRTSHGHLVQSRKGQHIHWNNTGLWTQIGYYKVTFEHIFLCKHRRSIQNVLIIVLIRVNTSDIN